jgi:hypothetical protein
MPSTYDPLLRLELQATGENATTWGVKTNTNLDLLAESIAGAVNLNVAGSGDYTLSTANGAEDEARQAILVLTGLLTGNRNIIVPSSPKNYTVINNTTGAFTVTLKQSAGSGVALVSAGPTITVCTSTTCVDAVGASVYGRSLVVTTSAEAARLVLGATSIGNALFIAADTSAGRAAINAIGPGSVTTSGLTMNTARLLGRTTASSGAIEEITVGSGLSLSAGSLTVNVSATQLREQLFTAGGSWTAPTGVSRVEVIVIGGGGGGGGYNTSSAFFGSNGGSGGVAIGNAAVSAGTSYTVTIGTGGAAGGNNANGSAGGTSSFGSISATGGGGGLQGAGGAGSPGTGSGGSTLNSSILATGYGVTPLNGIWLRGNASGSTAAVAWSTGAGYSPGAAGSGGQGDDSGNSFNNSTGGVNGVVYLRWVGA